MVLKRTNQALNVGFFSGILDLKEYVFINLRKQIRQKMEGVSAS